MESVIQSGRRSASFDWDELWQYRDLLILMVRRDLISRYKQTLLGPLWFILQPTVMAFVFVVVVNRTLEVSTGNIPPFVFYFSGLTLWSYVSLTIQATSTCLVYNSELFKKVYFPRILVPVSQSISGLIGFLIQFILLLILSVFFVGESFFAALNSGTIFLLPFAVIQLFAVGLGLGLWISALSVKFRDFHHLMAFGLSIWLYLSPISFSMKQVPEALAWLFWLNPISFSCELFRFALFSEGLIPWAAALYSSATALLLLVTAIYYFDSIQTNLIDTL